MKALITGVTGFAGSHLAEYLLESGIEVSGIVRWRSKTENIDHISNRLNLLNADVRDGGSLQRVVYEVQPDYIFHLAAQSFVQESWNSPLETLGTNILGTANLLEAVRQVGCNCIVHLAGSSEEYGLVQDNELPITETNPLHPLSPYGVSKVAVDLLGRQYYKSFGIQVIVTRAFNHTGARRGEVFATSNFAKQIAQIEKGLKPPKIQVGNLEAQRDWTDVRDMVKAYWLAVTKCDAGDVYNVCTGKAIRVGDMLDMLLGLSTVKITTVHDPSRDRPSDVPVLLGSADKFKQKTGWKPQHKFKETLLDLLNYWRDKV